jgi:hypothetical protein
MERSSWSAGAFSIIPGESKATGEALYLDPSRVYETLPEMFEAEKKMPPEKRIDFVSVVTPNHVHYGLLKWPSNLASMLLLKSRSHFNLDEAKSLQKLVEKSGLVLGTHSYVYRLSAC